MRFDKGYVLLIAFKHPQNKIRVKSASFKKPHLCHDCGYVTNTVQHLLARYVLGAGHTSLLNPQQTDQYNVLPMLLPSIAAILKTH